MAWKILRARNIKCFEDKMFDVMSVQKSAHAKWKDDMEGREIVEKNTQSSSVKDARGQRTSMDQMWKTPSAGIKKLNCDAAVGNKGKVGLGFVLRDENGRVLLAGKMECLALGSSTLAEALAMRYALKMVQQYHYTTEIMESDSQVLINNIQGKSTPEIYCEVILDDIQRLAREINCQKFCHIPRSANHVAHIAAHGHEFISIGHTPNHLMASVNANDVSGR